MTCFSVILTWIKLGYVSPSKTHTMKPSISILTFSRNKDLDLACGLSILHPVPVCLCIESYHDNFLSVIPQTLLCRSWCRPRGMGKAASCTGNMLHQTLQYSNRTSVSIMHQTLTWTIRSFTCVCDIFACVYMQGTSADSHTWKTSVESAQNWTPEKNVGTCIYWSHAQLCSFSRASDVALCHRLSCYCSLILLEKGTMDWPPTPAKLKVGYLPPRLNWRWAISQPY